MVEWVKESGFRCGFCETVSLYHEINIRRLELGYLRKLYMSFGESYYRIISKKKFYILRRMKWGMIEGFHFVRAFILNLMPVAAMLPTVFLPFNVFKGGLNMALTLLLYKPVVTALRKARLVPESQSTESTGSKMGFLLFSLALLATFTVLTLVLAGKI